MKVQSLCTQDYRRGTGRTFAFPVRPGILASGVRILRMTRTSTAAPKHLSRASKGWWRTVMAEYELEPPHFRLLQAACESWDRAQEARERITADGAVIADRFGQLRPHPAIAIERDSRLAFARLVRELDLDGEPGPEPRMPRR